MCIYVLPVDQNQTQLGGNTEVAARRRRDIYRQGIKRRPRVKRVRSSLFIVLSATLETGVPPQRLRRCNRRETTAGFTSAGVAERGPLKAKLLMNDSYVQEISNLPLRYGAAAAPNQRLGGRGGGALFGMGEVEREVEVGGRQRSL